MEILEEREMSTLMRCFYTVEMSVRDNRLVMKIAHRDLKEI